MWNEPSSIAIFLPASPATEPIGEPFRTRIAPFAAEVQTLQRSEHSHPLSGTELAAWNPFHRYRKRRQTTICRYRGLRIGNKRDIEMRKRVRPMLRKKQMKIVWMYANSESHDLSFDRKRASPCHARNQSFIWLLNFHYIFL